MQPLLQWKSNKYYLLWVCVCSLRYPASNAHVLYCHLWPVRLYNITKHYLINMIFRGKNLLKIKRVFWLSLRLLPQTFLTPRTQWDMIKMYIGLHVKYPLFLLDFNNTLIFLTDFEKYSNTKFQENPSSGSRDVPCGQTDRHDEAKSRYPQFCERA